LEKSTPLRAQPINWSCPTIHPNVSPAATETMAKPILTRLPNRPRPTNIPVAIHSVAARVAHGITRLGSSA
jgi:hypothetical protein